MNPVVKIFVGLHTYICSSRPAPVGSPAPGPGRAPDRRVYGSAVSTLTSAEIWTSTALPPDPLNRDEF